VAAPIAAFPAITRPGAARACTRRLEPEGRSEAEDGGARLSCLARKARHAPGKKAAREPLRARAASGPIALWEGQGAALSEAGPAA